jgi:hypothetical protein
MTIGREATREKIRADVQNGRLTPAEADEWAKAEHQEPFDKPDFPVADAMALERWTLAMTAAWFIWHSPEAVRDQWDSARQGWRKWERVEHGKGMPSPSLKWRLKNFGHATLAEIFSQAGFRDQIVNDARNRGVDLRDSNALTHNAYDRMRCALGWGLLTAFRVAPAGKENAIPAGEWAHLFGRLTRRARPPVPQGSDKIGSASVKGTYQGASKARGSPVVATPKTTNAKDEQAPILDERQLEDLLNIDTSESDYRVSKTTRPIIPEKKYEILLPRAEVIAAETEISRREFDRPVWAIEQVLGLLAYQSESECRSIGEADLSGRKYFEEEYKCDLKNPHPDKALFESIVQGGIKAYRNAKRLKKSERMEMKSVWDAADVTFSRDDAVKLLGDKTPDSPLAVLPNMIGPRRADLLPIICRKRILEK